MTSRGNPLVISAGYRRKGIPTSGIALLGMTSSYSHNDSLILGGARGQIFLDHQRYLEDNRVLKLAQIETGELLDLL